MESYFDDSYIECVFDMSGVGGLINVYLVLWNILI